MLSLRRGIAVAVDPLTVEIDGRARRAWADTALVGEIHVGDELIVNTVALDLELGSGGFDIVHVNLTRGLAGRTDGEEHVIKLNYSSLQHPVAPVEALEGEYGFDQPAHPAPPTTDQNDKTMPALILPLHGHLAPACFALDQTRTGLKVGFIQSGGGALPGGLSRDVTELRRRGLLSDHITAGNCYGGEREAITLAGGLEAAIGLGWDVAIVGPGPGILGSATRLGHGGLAALDAAHTALALGLPTILSPRLSQSDPRPRHRGLSHHSARVLELLLAPVTVAVPEDAAEIATDIRALSTHRHEGHSPALVPTDLEAYLDSGLPRRTMGRDATDDPLFFAAPLAAGRVAAESVAAR